MLKFKFKWESEIKIEVEKKKLEQSKKNLEKSIKDGGKSKIEDKNKEFKYDSGIMNVFETAIVRRKIVIETLKCSLDDK